VIQKIFVAAFKSEGHFPALFLGGPERSQSHQTKTTDAYDSVEWLVTKMFPDNNGKVGMYGVSYDGLTTAPHAAASLTPP